MTGAPPARKSSLERGLETGLFAARWLMAPFYVGLAIALAALLWVFGAELAHDLRGLLSMNAEGAILMALSLIDLSLAGNLLLIVIYSGYETFVSRIDTGEHEDRPAWMGTVDFSGLKMKLIASIVAISAVALLKAFLELGDHAPDPVKLSWMVGIHLSFVVSGVLLAVMDWLNSRSSH